MRLQQLHETGIPPGQIRLIANVMASVVQYLEAGQTEKALRLCKEVQKSLREMSGGVNEGYGENNAEYQKWIKACRKIAPDCQITGGENQAQAVWWNDKNNPVIGDWDGKKGETYPLKTNK